MTNDFVEFPKIPRLSREIVITEKIDGTNACVCIYYADDGVGQPDNKLSIRAGSRTRWITPEDDNHGFAKWVHANRDELIAGLGEGTHFGEWWGSGIQRGYGLTKGEKRFSLFNTHRWGNDATRPKCCHVVPVLAAGVFNTDVINTNLALLEMHGSMASPGFMNPEGLVIFHTAGNLMFKKTLEKDNEWKGK